MTVSRRVVKGLTEWRAILDHCGTQGPHSEHGGRSVLAEFGRGRVRISGQLIEAATGVHIWADRFDRKLSDIFAVQDEITESVAASIEPRIKRAEIEAAARGRPNDLNAYNPLLRAQRHYYGPTKEDFERALRQHSGFFIEYGWGGRVLDPATWQPHETFDGPSLWGHDRLQMADEQRGSLLAGYEVAATARGIRAPNPNLPTLDCPWFDVDQCASCR